ncbi:hypothetical protein [Halalkalibacter oceani]|uniref:hypothetical protein n=1 Tax=Halalkalibacter oceani TaxID=1653776 RepID=UPI003391B96A
MMKRIETPEQKEKALKWMVEMAGHPLEPVIKDEKTRAIYERTAAAVQDYNDRFYKGLEYPSLEEEKQEPQEKKLDLSGWLD